jgi:hypothetical protein
MAEKATQDDEIAKLRARIGDLEAALNKATAKSEQGVKSGQRPERDRVADSLSNASRQKVDAVNRLVRGLTVASFEGMRLVADSFSAFAGGVVSRSSATDSKSVRDLATRLPSDILTGVSEAVDRLVDVPAKTAERFAETHRQGADTTTSTPSCRWFPEGTAEPVAESGRSCAP